MYDVLDVCRYIVKYSDMKNLSVSNLKLQKLLYFIQAMFLVNKNERCFKEKIVAWEFGPVVQEAYHYFKRYGGLSIPAVAGMYCANGTGKEKIKFNENVISQEDKKMINHIVDKLSKYSASYLVEVTHRQLPWKNAYIPYANNEITPDAIKEYFEP